MGKQESLVHPVAADTTVIGAHAGTAYVHKIGRSHAEINTRSMSVIANLVGGMTNYATVDGEVQVVRLLLMFSVTVSPLRMGGMVCILT